MKKWILGISFVIGVSFLHYYLRGSSATYNFFLPPNDLYSGSVESAFDLGAMGLERQLTISHKYPGRHMVAFSVEKPEPLGTLYEANFLVEISAQSSEGMIVKDTFPISGSYFQGGPWAFLPMWVYSAPAEVPLRESVIFNIKVLQADPDFSSKYGNVKLFIGKVSDE